MFYTHLLQPGIALLFFAMVCASRQQDKIPKDTKRRNTKYKD